MKPRKHHPFGPSTWHRRAECAASYLMEKDEPDRPSPAAEEGTKAHDAVMLNNVTGLPTDLWPCVDRCRALLSEIAPGTKPEDWTWEKRLKAPIPIRIVEGDVENFELDEFYGYVDAYYYSRKARQVHFVEWKFGRVMPDTTALIRQCLGYGYLLLWRYKRAREALGTVYLARLDRRFSVTVRRDPVPGDKSIASIPEIEDFAAKMIGKALEVEPTYNPGYPQCEYCRGLHRCEAARAWMEGSLAMVRRHVPVAPEVLKRYPPPEAMASALDTIKIMEQWISEVQLRAKEYLGMGLQIPGWYLKERRGKRYVEDVQQAAVLLQDYLTPAELVPLMKFDVTRVEKAFLQKARERHTDAPEGNLRKLFEGILGDTLRRGDSSQVLTKGDTADDHGPSQDSGES